MPRIFDSGAPGYSNASLATTGIAIAFPPSAYGAIISVSAGCYLGFRNSTTLATFSDTNYGSIYAGGPHRFDRMRDGTQTHIHIAPWTSTAIVAVMFM